MMSNSNTIPNRKVRSSDTTTFNMRKFVGASILGLVFGGLFLLGAYLIGPFETMIVFGGVIMVCGGIGIGVYLLMTPEDNKEEEVQG